MLAFYNISDIVEVWIEKLIVASGLIFSLIFFTCLALGVKRPLLSLAIPNIERFNHHHIGDFWALVLIIIVSWFLIKKRPWQIILALLGTAIIFISSSRSAIMAAAGGIGYLLIKSNLAQQKSKFIKWLFAIFTGIFIFLGINKPTLLSRVYFLEAVDGFIKNPLGVGLGNFIEISRKSPFSFVGGRYFVASMTHNLLLEVLIGIGIFSVSFFVWLGFVARDIWKNNRQERVIFGALSLGLLVNFLFDFTYINPAMIWLWFALLGLAQSYRESKT